MVRTTFCIFCKGVPSASPSAAPTNLSTHRRISVDKMYYGLARFGRQKAPVNRKYGHDTQGVAGSSPARPTEVPGQAYYFSLNCGKTCNVWQLSATPSATRPSECDSCQQRRQQLVRLKIVEVSEIFAYVRAIFDASLRKLALFQLRNSLPRLESVRLRPVES